MSARSLEERIATLETQFLTLVGRKSAGRTKDWRKTIGMFAGDEIMREVCQNALAIREEDRRRSLAELDAQAENPE